MLTGNRIRALKICIYFPHTWPPSGEMMMTSFPVFIKLGITSKESVLKQKLRRNTNRKPGLAVLNNCFSFWAAASGEIATHVISGFQ